MTSVFTQGVLSAFYGSLLTLLLAFIVWLLKSALDNHKNQINALAKIERIYINNFAILIQNKSLLKFWLKALKEGRPYSCFFRELVIESDCTLMIHDIVLVNKIVKNNFSFQGLNDDTNQIYADYRKILESLFDDKITHEIFAQYGKNLLLQMDLALPSIEKIEKETVNTLAHIRLFGENLSRYSFFGFLNFLNKDFFPKISEKRLKNSVQKLENEFDEKLNNAMQIK